MFTNGASAMPSKVGVQCGHTFGERVFGDERIRHAICGGEEVFATIEHIFGGFKRGQCHDREHSNSSHIGVHSAVRDGACPFPVTTDFVEVCLTTSHQGLRGLT